MSVPYEKMLEKAHMMRRDYDILSHSVTHPEVPVGSYQELEKEFVPGYTTKLLIYRPLNAPAGPLPVYIPLHSGAFARGSAYFDHYVNSVTCNRVGCIVVAVEFQLAPEGRFPTQIEECYAAAKWVYDNAEALGADPKRIAIGGHNSGGTLAAAVCLLQRDRGEFPLCCAILDCSMFTLLSDHDELPDFDMSDPMRGPIRGTFFNTCYLGNLSLGATNPLASPLYAESVANLPPTLVVIAGLDASREDAEAYYARLQEAGNDCELILHEGLPHGFNVQPGLADQSVVDKSFEMLDNYLIRRFAK